jgi:hypothetical protein
MAKKAKQRFVLSLKLDIEQFQEDILSKRFEIGRQLYNAVLGQALNRYKEMSKTKRYKYNQKSISDIYKANPDKNKAKKLAKSYFKIRNDMLSEFRLSEYSLHADIAAMQKVFKNNIDSFTAQKIASNAWKAFDKLLFGNGEIVHFKKYANGLNSLEGKSNNTGIKYKIDLNRLEWNGLSIPVALNINNEYETSALRNKICYCRVKRKFVRGMYKYILQLVLEGVPPIKINKLTGEIKNDIGVGNCGIDIGTQTVAFITNNDCKLYELAPSVQNIEDEKRRLSRYLDRSRRSSNLCNFNDDGTIKKGVKLKWAYSNKYIKAKNKLKDLYRKQTDVRNQEHNIMANEILETCDTVLVETMNFKGLQSRAKKTETNDKGKFKKKKRFGKSIANKTPSMFLTILNNKLKSKGGTYLEVNTYKVKASQYNHLSREYNKKKLSQRWNYFDYDDKTIKVQRDMYSAFLIKNVNSDLETINNEKCIDVGI